MLEISNAMVARYKEAFGRGPTKARARFVGDDTLLVTLESSLTVAERNLVAMGEHQRLREARLFLVDALEGQFRAIVEQALGRKTLAYVSGLDTDRDLTVKLFTVADVDPMYFDHPHFLVPAGDDDGSVRAYRLLSEVMSKTDRAALGRLVMRAKEYLGIVRHRDGALTLTTMRFADEVRDVKGIDAAHQKSHKPTRKQLDAAVAIIEALCCDWDPVRHKDRYRARLKRVVDRKRRGETIKVSDESDQPGPRLT